MLTNQKQYVINLANLSGTKPELVGELASFNREELGAGIPIPLGFVITTTAFDDFLVANDLVDFLAPRINDVDYTDIDAVKKAAGEIRKIIQKASLPQLIADPIAKAYGGMSGFTEAGINLLTSPVNKELERSVAGKGSARYHIIGQENLIAAVKELWADFFSLEALLYRNQIGYEGFLTEAIIVQKLVYAEVSGRIYTLNPTDNDDSVFEAQALWGGDDARVWTELVPDSYYMDSESGELLERKIVGQEWMLVRKGKPDGHEPFMKVRMSQPVQKRAKLDDRYLHQLFVFARKIADMKGSPQEISFNIEGGRIFIVDAKDYNNGVDIATAFPLKSSMSELGEKGDWGTGIEIIPGKPEELDENGEPVYDKKAEKEFQQDLDKYVDEIENQVKPVVSVPEDVAVPPAEKLSEPETISGSKPVEEPAAEIPAEPVTKEVPGKRFGQPATVPAAIESGKVDLEPSEEKIVVDIKPLHELPHILKGKGNDKKVRFGLSHFVFEDFDLEDLTGDEILIIKELTAHNIRFANAVRGIIVEQEPLAALLEAITVPAIFGIKNAFEVVRDKEVITLEPQTGKIYLGAGVADGQPLPEPEQPVVAEPAVKAEPPAEPLPEKEIQPGIGAVELPQHPQAELEVAAGISDALVQEAEAPHSGVLLEEPREVQGNGLLVSVYEDPSIAPLNATSEFWQSIEMQEPRVDTKNTTGIIITADQLYQAWEMEPSEVYTEKTVFRNFLFRSVNFIKDLILKSNGRSIIYQSASRTFLEAKGITDHVHDMVLVDLEVVSWLRNRENLRNVWYSFADVLTAEYLADLKKNVSSEGIRRSATFKIFAHISQPYSGIAVKSLVEDSNIDGIIIDLDKLVTSMGADFQELDDNLANFLRFVIETVNSNNCQVFLWNRNVAVDNAQIKLFLEKGLNNFIVPVNKIMETKLQVSDQELARLIKQKKRGRKRKKIDFGF